MEILKEPVSRREAIAAGLGIVGAGLLVAEVAGVYKAVNFLQGLERAATEPDLNYLYQLDRTTPRELYPKELRLGQPRLPAELTGMAGNFYNLWRWVDQDIQSLASDFQKDKITAEQLRSAIEKKPLYRALSGARDLGFRRLRIYINDAEAFRHRIPNNLNPEIRDGYWFLSGFQNSINPNDSDRYDFTVLDKVDCLFYLSQILGFGFGFEVDLSDAFNLIHAPSFFSTKPDKEPSLTSPFCSIVSVANHPRQVNMFFTDKTYIGYFGERLEVISQYRGKYTKEKFADHPQMVAVSPMNEPNPFAIPEAGVTRRQAHDWFAVNAKLARKLFPDKILVFGYGQQGNINQSIEDLTSIPEIVLPFHFYYPALNRALYRAMAFSLQSAFQRSRIKPLYLQEINFDFSRIPQVAGLTHDQLASIFLKQAFQALTQDGTMLTNGLGCWSLTIPDKTDPGKFDQEEELNEPDHNWIVPGMKKTAQVVRFLDQVFTSFPTSC